MDQLAREGVRYTRHYANPVCSPARAALLTGQYPERHGFLPNGRGISPEVVTLPERLQEAGYHTWHLGKWHIGALQRQAWPDQQGFDHWLGFLNQWRLAGKMQAGELVPARPRYDNPWLQGDSEPGRHFPGHLETVLTEKAIEVMNDLNSGEAPWLLNLWYYAPHSPISPAPEFASRYPDTPAGRYRAHVNQLDSNIGRLLAHLDTLGAAGDTIVIMVSDNGGTNKQLDNNTPFAGRKGQLSEGGLRTPLVIRWPDRNLNGRVTDEIVSIRDLNPTLLQAAGLEIPAGLDAVSLHPAADATQAQRNRALFWEHGPGQGMLSADGRWRYFLPNNAYGVDLPPELYDLQADPGGASPVKSPPAEVINDMHQQLQAWYHDVHVVPTTLTHDKQGSTHLTGSSLQRTPGFGGYTFGIGIDGDSMGQLVRQEGAWSLHRDGNRITVTMGQYSFGGEITTTAECHAVAISGIFYRHLSTFSGPDGLFLNLYIDGELVGELREEGVLEVPEPGTATILDGSAGAGRKPVILNVPLEFSPFLSPESFSQQLCDPA
jgi:arylsulfatase A-like enzyme